MDGWMDGWMEGLIVGWTDGWMEGLIVRWMDGWMDGWTDGRTDGWLDGLQSHLLFGLLTFMPMNNLNKIHFITKKYLIKIFKSMSPLG